MVPPVDPLIPFQEPSPAPRYLAPGDAARSARIVRRLSGQQRRGAAGGLDCVDSAQEPESCGQRLHRECALLNGFCLPANGAAFQRRRRGSRGDDRRPGATSRSTGRDTCSPARAPSVKEYEKSWRYASVTACRDIPTNERKRETSLPYARCVLGLRPCNHSFSNCSSLLASRFDGSVIPSPSWAPDERRIMALLTHLDYRN